MAVACPCCREAIAVSPAPWGDAARGVCYACTKEFDFVLFPAAAKAAAPPPPKEALIEGASTCFYHPGKPAVRACEGCGAFLCSLCDLDLGNVHLCPRCLEKGETGTKARVESNRLRYDGLACGLALVPFTFIFWIFGFVTAPLALFVSLRYWKKPMSLVRRGKGYFIAALVLALIEIVGGALLVVSIVAASKHQAKPHVQHPSH